MPTDKRKQCAGLLVFRRPAETADTAHDRINEKDVENVRSKKGDTRSGQTEIPDTDPSKTHVDHSPGQFTAEEDTLNALRQDDETHRPTDHAQRHPQTDPPQKVTGVNK